MRSRNAARASFERLESRCLLATVAVTTDQDVNDGDTSSIASLVSTPGADGLISLREAMLAANNTPNLGGTPDEIEFNIPGGGVRTIQPTAQLPFITDAVVIDGYTQPEAMENTNAVGAGLNSVLRIELDGQNVPDVAGISIGPGASGSEIRGLVINRFAEGIVIFQSDDNTIAGNFIGTDVSGTVALGGGDPLAGTGNGIIIFGNDADNNTIGGSDVASRNLISGNQLFGVLMVSQVTGNVVAGNLIGTDITATAALGNGDSGVHINGDGASGNTIGGNVPSEGNAIAFNGSDGVEIVGLLAVNNLVRHNAFFNNAGHGIDLGTALAGDGFTPNDAEDDDEGPNRTQNFPEMESAVLIGDTLEIRYTVPTDPSNADYPLTVNFYLADSAMQEGQMFVAADSYSVFQAESQVTISVLADASFAGAFLVGTATDGQGNTSEFSLPLQIVLAPDALVLGSPPTLLERELSIENAADEDFFQYIAHQTGKMSVRIFFPHNDGDLRLEVRGAQGNLIATADQSSSTNNREELVVPVVGQETYLVRVAGVGGATNDYSLEIENFAAPIPDAVFLDPAFDNGSDSFDNIISTEDPQIFIQADLLNFLDDDRNGQVDAPPEIALLTAAQAVDGTTPGAAVEVFVNGVSVGFADPVTDPAFPATGNPTLFQFTVPTDALDGILPAAGGFLNLVTAAVRIFDGHLPPESGRSPLSDPLRLTFADVEGPQVTAVEVGGVPDFDLFVTKPTDGPTPLVTSLIIRFEDQPERVAGSLHDALNALLAASSGHFVLVGDHHGHIPLAAPPTVINVPTAVGDPAIATIELTFTTPLPDDRYTLTISDALADTAGNPLDGESNAGAPGVPTFPTGDGLPGGDFIARFTVDSRPEIGVYAGPVVSVDINGNSTYDPSDGDAVHRDLSFAFGNINDQRFAGKFLSPEAPPPGAGGLFDVLAAYGRENGVFRFLIDLDGNGAFDPSVDLHVAPVGQVNGLAVAGNFDGDATNGDEVGIFTGTTWYLDLDHDFDPTGPADLVLPSPLRGYPIVGDFDGDEADDLATFQNNVFHFDLSFNGFGAVDQSIAFGAPGVLDRPAAADMDGDGIDDIGLWIPNSGTQGSTGEWRFLVSDDRDATERIFGEVNTLDHPFSPAPLGSDYFAHFGDVSALPLVGNFDPPVAAPADVDSAPPEEEATPPEREEPPARSLTNPLEPLDVNDDGFVSPADVLEVFYTLNTIGGGSIESVLEMMDASASDSAARSAASGGSSDSIRYLDVSGDGHVSPRDALTVMEHLNLLSTASRPGRTVVTIADAPSAAAIAGISATSASGQTASSADIRVGDASTAPAPFTSKRTLPGDLDARLVRSAHSRFAHSWVDYRDEQQDADFQTRDGSADTGADATLSRDALDYQAAVDVAIASLE
ncbi:MAG: right-handed parallel beta-helix repeat-containing protein [Pirellulales bacterium]